MSDTYTTRAAFGYTSFGFKTWAEVLDFSDSVWTTHQQNVYVTKVGETREVVLSGREVICDDYNAYCEAESEAERIWELRAERAAEEAAGFHGSLEVPAGHPDEADYR